MCITIDSIDNIYVANKSTPVIRKYSPDGKLLMAFTFKLPFKTGPVEIFLNDRGDEIRIVREDENPDQVQVSKEGKTTSVQRVKTTNRPRVGTSSIGVDSQQRIYIITKRRLLTEKERRATSIGWGFDMIDRRRVDYNIVESIDAKMIMVFSPGGKIIAETTLTTFCDSIYISNNRIFIIDGTLNQRILEYKMIFEKEEKT